MNYITWLRGGSCCQPINNCGCSGKDVCDCQEILLEISKLHTDDEILQDEIDYVSGVVDTISGGCDCDLTDYYTKEEVDALIPEVPSLSGYATEQWVLDKHYITGVDLSDYVTYDDIPDLTSFATKEWVLNQNFVTNIELIQYITNLQEQINSLTSAVSGCCGETGETQYRWVTMTGENDYWCSGTTKYSKEKEQSSTDGINWTDTGNIRSGSTILEVNSVDCGYEYPFKLKGVLHNGSNINIDCNSSTVLTREEVHTTNRYNSIEIGGCVTEIGEKAFLNEIYLTGVTIPSGVTKVGYMSFANSSISSLTLNEGLKIIDSSFKACLNLSSVTIPNSVSAITGDAFYTNNIKTVVIGSGITSIAAMAFQKSSGSTPYESITILATTPPTLANDYVFSDGHSCPIYVPAQSVNAYKTAQHWSYYASRIQAIQT